MKIKIVSWNVNGIRAVQKKGLFDYLKEEDPDIFCVQETKASPDQLDDALRIPENYHVLYHSCSRKKGYSGVATFSKIKPLSCSTGFGIENFDNEGRVAQTDFGDFVLLNVYFPNGNMEGRLQYKLEFFEHFFAHCSELRKNGKKLIICGDYNIAHKAIDLSRPKENIKVSGFLPVETAWLDKIVADGYVDSFREFNKEPGNYTWWNMKTFSRPKNIGWRIDYHFVTEDLMDKVTNAKIQKDIMGSDHCPVELELEI
ncbi:MAG: exodeoxyribonuclease III [Candidatus Sericytochromatia bacterium]|nr:exodeoxyribonuclease III [Candidatus Sericytochromatia bacterium]